MQEINLPTDEQLTNEQRKQATRVNAKRARNAERIAKIESLGVAVDIPNARIDHVIASLFSLGILDAGTVLQIQEDWEDKLRVQSKDLLGRIEAQYERALREREKERIRQTGKTSSGLVVPPSAAGV